MNKGCSPQDENRCETMVVEMAVMVHLWKTILIMTIQVNLVPNPGQGNTNSHEALLLKFLSLTYVPS